MTIIASSIREQIKTASWIRRMFEAGAALKKQYGEDAVCDFSLGNPDLPSPPSVAEGLRKYADKALEPLAFGYIPNNGAAWAREALAAHLSHEQGVALSGNDLILTCGAAGGLNVLFRTILNPGDEVVAIAPYFVEYGAYVGNHGGVLRAVASKADVFTPDLDALDAAIGPRTRALIINSPNNPTGQVYSQDELSALCALLTRKSTQYGTPILLVADEPYRFLTYDGIAVPSCLALYPYTVVASSFSKSLSLAGERIGYLAVSPLMEEQAELINGLTLSNRILGFVNPPVVGQYLMVESLNSQVDASVYRSRRDAMAEVLTEAGYEFFMPRGAFYFFPKAPGGDDVAFTQRLLEEKILGVPGSGFAGPGYFRLTSCVDEAIIRRALPGLKKARAAFA